MIKSLGCIHPKIDSGTFIADTAVVIGNVEIGDGSSIWYNAVLRGDINKITIGKYSNVQDNATVHTESYLPAKIGDYTVVGHNALVHGCTVGNNTLIGMGSIIMNNVSVGNNCIIGAGTVITEGKKIPDNSMVLGIPGKIVRQVTEEEIKGIKDTAIRYNELFKKHIE